MKWVGLGVNFDGLGWVDKNGPMSMSALEVLSSYTYPYRVYAILNYIRGYCSIV